MLKHITRRILSIIIQYPIPVTVTLLCVIALTAYLVYRLTSRRRLFLRAMAAELHRQPDDDFLGAPDDSLRGRLEGYVPHMLRSVDDETGTPETADVMAHRIKKSLPELTVLYGEAGIGKSDLALYLAYKLRKASILRIPGHLSDFNEVFLELSGFGSVQEIVGELSRLTDGHKPMTVLLDGFDEFCDAQTEPAVELWRRLINQLTRSGVFDKCLHLIITVRLDVFSDGLPAVGDIPSTAWAVLPITIKQGKHIYTNVSRACNEPSDVRGAKLKTVEGLIRRESHFCRPLILKWAPRLLGSRRREDAGDLPLFILLDRIFAMNIRKRYNALCAQQPDTADTVSFDRFRADYRRFAREAALLAVGDRPLGRIPAERIEALERRYPALSGKKTPDVPGAGLLVYTPADRDREMPAFCRFPSRALFFWLLADALADPDTDERLRTRVRSWPIDELHMLCLEAVFCRHGDSLEYPECSQFCTDVTERNRVRVRPGKLKADTLLRLLPDVKTVSIRQFRPDEGRTADLMQHGVLDMTDCSADLSAVIDCITPDIVRTLDVAGLGMDQTDMLLESVGRLPALEELDIGESRVDYARLLERCPRREKLRLLCAPEPGTPMPDDPSAYRFRELSLILPRAGLDESYESAYRLLKAGVPVSVRSACICEPDDECSDASRAEAVWALETRRLYREENGRAGGLPADRYLPAFNVACLLSQMPEVKSNGLLPDIAAFLDGRILIFDTHLMRSPMRWPEDKTISARAAQLVDLLVKQTDDPFIRVADISRIQVRSTADRESVLAKYRAEADRGNVYALIWLGVADRYGYYGLRADNNQALARFEAALAAHPDEDVLRVQILYLKGDLLAAIGKDAEAETDLRGAYRMPAAAQMANEMDTARLSDALGDVLIRRGGSFEAVDRLKEALSIREAVQGTDHPETVQTVYRLGIALYQSEKYAEAYQCFERTAAVREARQGRDSVSAAYAYYRMGVACRRLTRYTDAAELLSRTLETWRTRLGATHPDTIKALCELGTVYQTQGRYDTALACFREAQTAFEETGLSQSSEAADVCVHMGETLRALGQLDEAEAQFSRAYAIRGQLEGDFHADTVEAGYMLGLTLYGQGRYAEAAACLRRAADAETCTGIGSDPTTRAYALYRLGESLQRIGRISEAAEPMGKAVTALEETIGADHRDTVTAYRRMGEIMDACGEYDEAFRFLNRVRIWDEKQYGDDQPDMAATYLVLGGVLTRGEHFGRAGEYLEKALAIREKMSGPDHADTAEVCFSLGRLRYDEKKYPEALPYFERAFRIYKSLADDKTPLMATALFWRAKTLSRLERNDEAWVLLERTLKLRQSLYGDAHPATGEVWHELGDVLVRLGRVSEAAICREKEKTAHSDKP